MAEPEFGSLPLGPKLFYYFLSIDLVILFSTNYDMIRGKQVRDPFLQNINVNVDALSYLPLCIELETHSFFNKHLWI